MARNVLHTHDEIQRRWSDLRQAVGEGCTREQLCERFGVSMKTMNRWLYDITTTGIRDGGPRLNTVVAGGKQKRPAAKPAASKPASRVQPVDATDRPTLLVASFLTSWENDRAGQGHALAAARNSGEWLANSRNQAEGLREIAAVMDANLDGRFAAGPVSGLPARGTGMLPTRLVAEIWRYVHAGLQVPVSDVARTMNVSEDQVRRQILAMRGA